MSNDDVLFHLPVTKIWIDQFVLAMMFMAHASYRNITTILQDLFDYHLSQGSIHNIFRETVDKVREIHKTEDLSKIGVTANDELFHHNQPTLTGIEIRSLYCYLLVPAEQRDEDTWAIHLLYAKDKGLNPSRTIGDDGRGLVAGHNIAFESCPYHYDNFHLSRDLMELRRFFRNRLKTVITELNTLRTEAIKSVDNKALGNQVGLAKAAVDRARDISKTLDTLISWLEHDILKKTGSAPSERRELYDFVVAEFKNLERREPHRIRAMRITLENQRDSALAFAEVLEYQFKLLGQKYNLPTATLW